MSKGDWSEERCEMKLVLIGARGALGEAMLRQWSLAFPAAQIFAFSSLKREEPRFSPRVVEEQMTYEETSIAAAAKLVASYPGSLRRVFVATGALHREGMMPERSLKELSEEKLATFFALNAITPALIAKHFLPQLERRSKAVFAALCARVGSIGDNYLGGWYSYRASKAALMMLLKSASIEIARSHPQAIVVGLHPGTVESELSRPFWDNVAKEKRFSPEQSARYLHKVIEGLEIDDRGHHFAWDGSRIDP